MLFSVILTDVIIVKYDSSMISLRDLENYGIERILLFGEIAHVPTVSVDVHMMALYSVVNLLS